MARKRRSLTESLSVRSAKVRRKTQSHRLLRWLGGRGVATLAVGAALSVGGLTEALQGVDAVVPRDSGTTATSPPVLAAAVTAVGPNEPAKPPHGGLQSSRIH